MYKKIFIFTIVFLGCLNAKNINNSLNYTKLSIQENLDSKIMKLWSQTKSRLQISVDMIKDSPIELYFLASESYNILHYAFQKNNPLLIEELLQLYMQTIPHIKKKSSCSIFHLNEKQEQSTIKLKQPIYIWVNHKGDEELISSAQFLFVVSFSFYQISNTSEKKRTKTMSSFIEIFSPILSSHYRRWILGLEQTHSTLEKRVSSFDRRGWGCKDKNENYIYARTLNKLLEELGEKAYHGASYCNVIADPSLLIVSGLGYYLGGTETHSKSLYPIEKKEALKRFFYKGIKIIAQEFKEKITVDFTGNPLTILSFQEGAWYGHPDYDYSGYSGKNFPTQKDKKAIASIGLDVAHGNRVLYFLEMLIANKKPLNLLFPLNNHMKMFTNGFVYNVFNGDNKHPLFKNYMNGSNGWFRVNYDSRKGYGYAPFSIGSSGAVLGGYPRLAKYNKKLETSFISLYHTFNSSKKRDRLFIHSFYGKPVWTEGEKREIYHFEKKELDSRTALFLMNFYSSLL